MTTFAVPNAFRAQTALLRDEEPTEVFQSLRDQFAHIRDEYGQAWAWKRFLNESPELGKQQLLDYAASLHEIAKQIDRCYYQLAVRPEQTDECMEVMSALDNNAGDLWTRCETMKTKLEQTTVALEETTAERDRLSRTLTEKTEECAKYKSSWEEELSLRKGFQDKLYTTEEHLKTEKDATSRLSGQVNVLTTETIKLDAAKRERMLRAVGMMQLERGEGLVGFVFNSMRRVLQMERINRLRDATEGELQGEVTKLEMHRESLTKKLHATENDLADSRATVARLKEERTAYAQRMLKTRFGACDGRLLQRRMFDDWTQVLALLKVENKLSLIESDYDKTAKSLATTKAKLEETQYSHVKMQEQFDEFRELKRKERKDTLIRQFHHVVWLRVGQTRTIREMKALAKKQFDEACQARDERIKLLEKCLRDDSHVVALEKHCHEMEWEMEQTLQGPPSKVVAPDDGTLCAACRRQVVYQDYLVQDNGVGVQPEKSAWGLPPLERKASGTRKQRFHRVWQP